MSSGHNGDNLPVQQHSDPPVGQSAGQPAVHPVLPKTPVRSALPTVPAAAQSATQASVQPLTPARPTQPSVLPIWLTQTASQTSAQPPLPTLPQPMQPLFTQLNPAPPAQVAPNLAQSNSPAQPPTHASAPPVPSAHTQPNPLLNAQPYPVQAAPSNQPAQPATNPIAPTVHPVNAQPNPLFNQPYLAQAAPSQSAPAQPSRAGRNNRPAPSRPMPHSRPLKATMPPPPRPKKNRVQVEEVPDEDELLHKRPRGPRPNPNDNGEGTRPIGRAHVFSSNTTPGAGTSATPANDTINHATRQLAQPRDTPGSSQQNHANTATHASQTENLEPNMEVGDEDEAFESLQAEHDKVLESLYGGDGENGEPDMVKHLLCRLMARVIQKQDALNRSLQGIKQSRGSTGEGPSATTSSSLPPRPFPPQPSEKENWDQSVPHNEPAGRQPRLARKVLISRVIRKTIMVLLKRTEKTQPLPPSPPDEIRYPTAENFGIRWEEMEKSLFNRLAAKVVVAQVCKEWKGSPLTEQESNELPGMVSEHIRYLCRCWKMSQKENAEALKRAQLKKAAAASRRATLYESRLKIIHKFPTALSKHRHLITRLGLSGTSSDEEDPTRKGVYLIKRRPELSTHIQVLKRHAIKLDLAYSLWCKGPGSKGSQMHTRVPSDLATERVLNVTGLPVTCISGVWYNELTQPERDIYQFAPHRYDYTFPEILLTRNIGRHPNMIVTSDEEEEVEEMEEVEEPENAQD
ncbi:hypothetical protein FRC07_003038 [Ceratobasidium sp. 392]|nr:hypothetical protein FRC07_003038 [Ceratobasidium sp. 392]